MLQDEANQVIDDRLTKQLFFPGLAENQSLVVCVISGERKRLRTSFSSCVRSQVIVATPKKYKMYRSNAIEAV